MPDTSAVSSPMVEDSFHLLAAFAVASLTTSSKELSTRSVYELMGRSLFLLRPSMRSFRALSLASILYTI